MTVRKGCSDGTRGEQGQGNMSLHDDELWQVGAISSKCIAKMAGEDRGVDLFLSSIEGEDEDVYERRRWRRLTGGGGHVQANTTS